MKVKSSKLNLKPIGSLVLIEIKKEIETASGILIPNPVSQKDRGIVIDMGSKAGNEIKKGDQVLMKKTYGEEFESEDDILILVEYEHILAIIL